MKLLASREALDFETSLLEMRARSERRAWWIAGVCFVLMSLAIGGYLVLLPLKERVPFLVMANAYTGQATVARLTDRLPASLSAQDALDRANISTFVRARESYDSSTLGDRDWMQVFSMASAGVSDAYRNLHADGNAAQPFKLYGRASALRPRLISLQVDPQEIKGARKATVRFSLWLVDKATGSSKVLDRRIAQIEYRYDPTLQLSDEDRLRNPLGFRVTNYRVDADFGTPAEDTVQ